MYLLERKSGRISFRFKMKLNGHDFGENKMKTGLPDGLFSNQKSKFGKILEGLAMKVGHLVHFRVFC
jgi:hypothetical protein